MSETQRDRFIRFMEIQGVRVTPTKKGLFLRLPDGSSTVKHFTESDSRGEANLINRLRRAGVTHPDDQRTVMNLPAYITEGTITPATRSKVLDWTIQHGIPDCVYSKDLVADLGMDPGQVNRALYHTGFRPAHTMRKKQGRPWVTPDDVIALRDPAPDTVESITEEATEEHIEVLSDDPIEDSEGVDRFGTPESEQYTNPGPTITEAFTAEFIERHSEPAVVPEPGSAADTALGAPGRAEPEPEPEPQGPAEREFIDSVDSWPVDMAELLGTHLNRMVQERLEVLRVVGLEYEVRVWKKVQ
jgi:hypothetical protein